MGVIEEWEVREKKMMVKEWVKKKKGWVGYLWCMMRGMNSEGMWINDNVNKEVLEEKLWVKVNEGRSVWDDFVKRLGEVNDVENEWGYEEWWCEIKVIIEWENI